MAPTPSTPGPKRARTRERLLKAAAELFAQRGVHRTTLADIARRAGLTTGAIYGSFEGKQQLFLEIFDLPARGVDVRFRPGAPPERQMRLLGEAVLAFLPAAEARGVLFHEFHIYAATHPEFRAEAERRRAEGYRAIAGSWRAQLGATELKMPIEQFVAVVDAMIDGLVVQRRLTPSVITDEVILAAFAALA